MLCVEESQVLAAHTTAVLLLAPASYLVSQSRPASTKKEVSVEMHIQAVSCCMVQCSTITIAVFYHTMHYMTV